jgi:hypothetical protein
MTHDDDLPPKPGDPESATHRRLRTFPHVPNDVLMHPWDLRATTTLGKVPGLALATRKMMEYGLERIFYLENTADNVRVTDKMFPRLRRYLLWGCKILGVEEPELYVSNEPVPNAYTYGHTRPFIVLTSGLVDMLDEQERLFVIGHELGHIKFGHVLYTVLAENIRVVIDIIGRATLGVGSLLGTGLALPLLDWYRKAELSADRAALLCVQHVHEARRRLGRARGADADRRIHAPDPGLRGGRRVDAQPDLQGVAHRVSYASVPDHAGQPSRPVDRERRVQEGHRARALRATRPNRRSIHRLGGWDATLRAAAALRPSRPGRPRRP